MLHNAYPAGMQPGEIGMWGYTPVGITDVL